ncbi:MAG: virulence factor TspB C-terminal domain-related protein [Bacteroidota bacterium]
MDFINSNGGSSVIDNNFSVSDVTTNIDFSTSTPVSNFFGFTVQSSTCPADRSISLSFGVFTMPWTTFCGFASGLAPLILAMAYLVGTRNIFNAYVGT